MEKENLDIIDITKFVMSFMVVGIHTLGNNGIYPLFRIAVPLFFMISSYLFFFNITFDKNGDKKLKKFCIRNIKLYIFWFIVLSPIFLYFGNYLRGNILLNVIKLVIKIIFGSSFVASWYIVALIIDISFIYFFIKSNQNFKVMLLVSFFIYIICCLNSNYRNLLSEKSIIVMINIIYPGTIYNSFLVGLFWVSLGYIFTQKNIYDKKICKIGLLFSILLLMGEYHVVTKYHLTVDNDCYFMLIPVCYFIFKILVNCKWKSKKVNTKLLRKYSTIIYCIHGSLAQIVGYYLIFEINFINNILKFFIVMIMSLVLANIICKLEKRETFRLLRYSY